MSGPPASGPGSQNRPPVISGKPSKQASAEKFYKFKPVASDPNGDPLQFSVQNRPPWAIFNRNTGQLSGTPDEDDAGTWRNIRISVSDGRSSSSLPAFSIQVKDKPNEKPKIVGQPVREVKVGKPYKFRPTALDPDGDPLSFGIQNRPQWASFNSKNGQLAGTPRADDVGSYNNVRISVTDGDDAAQLATFRIEVTGADKDGFRVLWSPPTANVDGSTLVNLAGYRVYLGTRPGNYTTTININRPDQTSYEFDRLAPGSYFVVLTAVNQAGAESAPTTELDITL